ncbi:DUF6651 domain-containing protein [Phenylobacterium conjunctum]|uniref:DUF6651 domain-containing protein n=1 Tax=Phenylobacterium conjunctum TaxID=1298959 RepID=A0ABW3SXU3_9CAUL
MKLKIDENGAVVLDNGKPVYVADDGKEFALDGAHLYNRVRELTQEAAGHRQAKEAAEGKLQAYTGIEDPAAARRALETLANLDQKKLVDAGEVQRVKDEAITAVKAQFEPVVAERDRLMGELHREKVGGAFARSKFVADKLAIPVDLVEAYFGARFKLEEGRVVAFDPSGNKMFSRINPGSPADFEEALEMMVDAYPNRDHILKGDVQGGGGSQNRTPQGSGVKTIRAADFEKLSGAERAAKMADGFKVID